MALKLTVAAALAVAAVSVPAVVRAQVAAGTINVEVQDSSGALMPAANVTLTHISSGQTRTGVTAVNGAYRAAFMPVGEYSIKVEAPGFKGKTVAGFVLRVDQNATDSVGLDPGEVREIVEV